MRRRGTAPDGEIAMLSSRMAAIARETVDRLVAGQPGACAEHASCTAREEAAQHLRAVTQRDDDPELRRALARAYVVERQHPAATAASVPAVTHGDASLWSLTYDSQVTRPLSREEVQDILETSRRNNAERGVTGVLQSHGSRFVQTIEGPVGQVAELFGLISADPRHTAITILDSGPIASRRYADWRMAHEAIEEVVGGRRP